jgi:hypothetical protein
MNEDRTTEGPADEDQRREWIEPRLDSVPMREALSSYLTSSVDSITSFS